MSRVKTSRQLERVFKGIANHRRIDILFLIHRRANISLHEISDNLKCNFRTISEHTKKLVSAGLINKSYRGKEVAHVLSPYGQKINKILKSF